MRDDDLMRQLAATNPVGDADLDRLDRAAGAALREGIVMSGAPRRPARRRRLGRRTVLSGGLALGLVGGGLAYAAVENGWYDVDGPSDGLTCLSEWVDPTDGTFDEPGVATGGPALTADPVADCQEYQALSERPPIEDAVAFRLGAPSVYVAPRSQVPSGAELLEPGGGPEHELSLSLHDEVAGLGARCLDEDEAVAAARAELERLGLDDWTVERSPRPEDRPAERCAEVALALDPQAGGDPDDPRARTLVVTPEAAPDRDDLRGDDVVEYVYALRDTLRSEVTDRCVDLATAEAVVTEAIGEEHHWPTTAVVDEDAECTRAYLVVGGSMQVTLYGPESAGR